MSIIDIFNIENRKNNKTSLAKVLLIFYVLIASNFTEGLMSKQMKESLQSNRLMQHIIGFLAMIVLVTTVGGIVDNRLAILYSLIGYLWFIFTTKLDIHWNVIILALLFVGYLYENSLSSQEQDILEDENLTEDKVNNIIKNNTDYRLFIVLTVIIITMVGTAFYTNKKNEQYGGGFDIVTYLLY